MTSVCERQVRDVLHHAPSSGDHFRTLAQVNCGGRLPARDCVT
jgi:hypothetical protein